ncbi:MAG: cytochrome b562 [Planctomycetota bacterium]|nr:cytochrome b562 [Planctomycetota bacterium]
MSFPKAALLKSRPMMILAALAAIALAPLALSVSMPDPAEAQAQSQPAASEHGAAGGLEDHMKKMNRSFKTLKRASADGKLTKESAALVADMEAHALACKDLVPPMASKLKGDEQAAFVLGYKKKLIEAIGQMLQLEVALLEGKNAEAATLLTAINLTEKQGHEAYNKEE